MGQMHYVEMVSLFMLQKSPLPMYTLALADAWLVLPELHSAAADCSENIQRLRSAGQQCREIQCLPTGISAVR